MRRGGRTARGAGGGPPARRGARTKGERGEKTPPPPIWIGGAGEKVTLKLVAQYGDACNFNADVETVRHKLEVLRQHCETVGRDYDSVLKTLEFYSMIGDEREIDRVVADHARRTGQEEAYIRSWHPLHGDADRIAELINEYAEAGIEYFIINLPNAFEGGRSEEHTSELQSQSNLVCRLLLE